MTFMDRDAKWVWLDYITPWTQEDLYRPQRIVGLLPSEKNRWGLFRRTFTLPDDCDVSGATIQVSVDSRYKLHVNGAFMGRGIFRCNRYNWYYDEYDISSALRPGKNVVAIVATYFGEHMSWYEQFPHGGISRALLGKGFLAFSVHVPSSGTVLRSDATVRGFIASAWDQAAPRINVGLPFMEVLDGRKLPDGWFETGFDDSGTEWSHAREVPVNDMWPNMVKRDIPPLAERFEPAVKVINAGLVDPFFDDEAIEESKTSGDEPVDGYMQLAQSPIVSPLPGLVGDIHGGKDIVIELQAAPVAIVVDMGREVTGFVRFEVEAPAGTVIDYAWSENLAEQRQGAVPFLRGFKEKYGGRYICKDGYNAFEAFHWFGFRYMQFNFSGTPGKVAFKELGVNIYNYPFELAGSFSCSDVRLDKLYDACALTLRNCAHDGYEDCPSREQRQWIGDAYVEIMSNHVLFGDVALERKLIRQAGQSQRGDGLVEMCCPGDHEIHGLLIPDYTLYWISIVYQHHWFTGDTSIIIEQLPAMLKAAWWFLGQINPATGLLEDMPYWTFIDWSANDKWGSCCVINAQLYGVLSQLISMIKIAGWDRAAEGLEKIANGIKDGINEYLWDKGRGAYIDAVVVSPSGKVDKRSKKVSFHANALAILHDICPPERVNAIIENVFARPYGELFVQNRNPIWTTKTAPVLDESRHVIVAEPFFMHHVNQALAKAGRHDLMMRFIRDGWVAMLDHGATTVWETWGNGGSHCHAWSTTPAYDLATHVLGVRLASPGGSSITIEPHPAGLTWAEGTVPVKKGTIHVRWEITGDLATDFHLAVDITAPAGIEVTVKPPAFPGASSSLIKESMLESGTRRHEFRYVHPA